MEKRITDRELLELAAKAAGVTLRYNYLGTQDARSVWNPIDNDGDALRLAVDLEIEARVFNGAAHAGKQGKIWKSETWLPDGDPYAATRRAIVRAAAHIWMNHNAGVTGSGEGQ